MSEYEQRRWDELNTRWAKRARPRRVLLEVAGEKMTGVGESVRGGGTRLAGAVGRRVPSKVTEAASAVTDVAQAAADKSLRGAASSAMKLVDLLNDWIVELQDPEAVLTYHREQGREVESIGDLADLDLEVLDQHTRRLALTWRTIGAAEGAGLGALALIPVPGVGSVAAIGLDIVAMQALATSIAIRVCHCYGFDVRESEMESVIDAMVSRRYGQQAAKAGTVHQVSLAWGTTKGRVNWSKQLRDNQPLLAGVEKLLKHATGKSSMPLRNVRMGLPGISVAAGAGVNQQVLGNTAALARDYAATLFLARKFGLDLPESLHPTE